MNIGLQRMIGILHRIIFRMIESVVCCAALVRKRSIRSDIQCVDSHHRWFFNFELLNIYSNVAKSGSRKAFQLCQHAISRNSIETSKPLDIVPRARHRQATKHVGMNSSYSASVDLSIIFRGGIDGTKIDNFFISDSENQIWFFFRSIFKNRSEAEFFPSRIKENWVCFANYEPRSSYPSPNEPSSLQFRLTLAEDAISPFVLFFETIPEEWGVDHRATHLSLFCIKINFKAINTFPKIARIIRDAFQMVSWNSRSSAYLSHSLFQKPHSEHTKKKSKIVLNRQNANIRAAIKNSTSVKHLIFFSFLIFPPNSTEHGK